MTDVGAVELGTHKVAHPTAWQRAIRGGKEGPAIGFIVALMRMVIAAYREGVPDDWALHIPRLLLQFAAAMFIPAYLFAIGRATAPRGSGAFVGAGVMFRCSVPVQGVGYPHSSGFRRT